MSPDPRPIVLGALLALHGVAAAAPPRESSLVATARLAQGIAGPPSQAEELPARPRSGQKVAAVRDPAVPPPGANTAPSDTSTTKSKSTAPEKDGAGAAEKGGTETATNVKGCGTTGCTSCTHQVPTCKPKWDDKKTKKATFTMTCDFECTRPWEPYHQGNCCDEKTTPCGNVHTKKKLFKTEEEKVERVLKYEVIMKPAAPCCEPEPACGCFGCRWIGCRWIGSAFERVFSWCH